MARTKARYMKVLLYGESGSAKTTWAARTAGNFTILTEHHAGLAIDMANPDAVYEAVDSWEEFQAVIDAIWDGCTATNDAGQEVYRFTLDGAEREMQTLVIDSLTMAHKWLLTHMEDIGTSEKVLWSKTQRLFEDFLDDIRRLPVNVVCTALERVSVDDQKRRFVAPSLFGGLSTKAPAYFSMVAYASKRYRADGSEAYGLLLGARGKLAKRPPSKRKLPRALTQDVYEPGQTTLGSVMMYMGLYDNPSVLPGDSPTFVEAQLRKEEKAQEKKAKEDEASESE